VQNIKFLTETRTKQQWTLQTIEEEMDSIMTLQALENLMLWAAQYLTMTLLHFKDTAKRILLLQTTEYQIPRLPGAPMMV
jgi:hypothetical protein